ncbi:hypothetical protein IWQ57_003488, partial [Coemansia nantahalensis]
YALLEHSYLQVTVVDLDTDRHLPLDIQKEMALQLRRDGKQRAVVSGTLSLAAGKIRLARSDGGTNGDVADNAPVGVPTTMAAPAAGPSLRGWTPERLAGELRDAGFNATAASQHEVHVSVPGGAATIRVRDGGGWTVDCTSATTQWAVADALRRLARPSA